jgi:hypothetical protein
MVQKNEVESEEAARYWRIRTGVELAKLTIWAALQILWEAVRYHA